jgi:hypothetical protein
VRGEGAVGRRRGAAQRGGLSCAFKLANPLSLPRRGRFAPGPGDSLTAQELQILNGTGFVCDAPFANPSTARKSPIAPRAIANQRPIWLLWREEGLL